VLRHELYYETILIVKYVIHTRRNEMGNRYFLEVTCPECGFHDDDVYYAPTCGITAWECPQCRTKLDLEKQTGISKEDASNKEVIKFLCDKMRLSE